MRASCQLVRGFTMIELLVVVSIIGLLAALLMPAITLVRDAADQTNCLSNLRQYGVASLTYSVDNDGFAIQIAQYEPIWDNHTHTHAFGSYAWNTCRDFGLERSSQASCPTIRRLNRRSPNFTESSYNYNEAVGGAYNLVAVDANDYFFMSAQIAVVGKPSELLLFGETSVIFSVSQNSNWNLRRNLRDLNANGLGNIDKACIVHRTQTVGGWGVGVENVVAADGHAQGIQFTQQALNLRWPNTRIIP